MRQTNFPNVTAQQQPRRSMNLQQQQASGGRDYQPRGALRSVRQTQMGEDTPVVSGDAWADVPSYKMQGE